TAPIPLPATHSRLPTSHSTYHFALRTSHSYHSAVVYLIGAGPGDPGLITVRGLACLSISDVVLYDHLVHPRLLAHAPADAERIDVGTAAPQAMAQEAICYLL